MKQKSQRHFTLFV